MIPDTDQQTLLGLEDSFSLDSTLDDVGDLPEFVNRFVGRGIFSVPSAKFESYTKEGVTKPRVRIIYKLLAVTEAGEDPMPAVGSMISETFSSAGKEYLKARLKSLIPDVAGVTVGQMLEYINTVYSDKDGQASLDITAKMRSKDGYDNIQIVKITPCELSQPQGQ